MSTNAQPAARRSPGPLQLLWIWLNSLPIAIVVMLLLAGFCAIGTLIPQVHLDAQPGVDFHTTLVQRFGEQKTALIEMLGFQKIYFTWYFGGLLVWLSVSAVVCNIVRYQRTMRMWKDPAVKRGPGYFTADKRALAISGAPATTLSSLAEELRAQRYRVVEAEFNGANCLYADRGFLKKWALVLLHFAVLVLLFGGMYGKAVGVESNIMMADGEKSELTLNVVEGKAKFIRPLLEKLPPRTYELDQQTYRIDYLKQIQLPSELAKIPEEFQEYYRYLVRDYISNLTVKKGNKTVTKEIKVNHPLVIDKLVIYQSGYQQTGYLAADVGKGPQEFEIMASQRCALTPKGLAFQDRPGGPWLVPVPGTRFGRVTEMPAGTPVSDHSFEFEQVKAGDLYDQGKNVGYMGPLTIATFFDTKTGESLGSQLVTPEKGFDTVLEGRPVHATMSKRIDNFSIFAYKRDPGIPILYFGWICMIVGVALTMYIGFTQVWARHEDAGQGRLLLLASGPGMARGSALSAKVRQMLGSAKIEPASPAQKKAPAAEGPA